MDENSFEQIGRLQEAPFMCRVVSIEDTAPHWHYEYEVFFVLQGEVLVKREGKNSALPGASEYQLSEGDIILFNTREFHSVVKADKANLCLLLQWSPALLLEVYKSNYAFELNTKVDKLSAQDKESFQSDLAEIGILIYEKPDGYQFYLKGAIYHFIGHCFGSLRYKPIQAQEIDVSIERTRDFDSIKKYIKEHFREEISIDTLCDAVCMSRSKVFNLFRAAGNITMKSILNGYRVEYARNLLINSDLSISYIAYESGFGSESSFYRLFKELSGLPPHHYREMPSMQSVPQGSQRYAIFQQSEAITLLHKWHD